MIELTLNWPPSVNNYWRKNLRGMFITAFGKAYRHEVWAEFKKQYPGWKPYTQRLALSILASPPDNRRRDLDNILKSVLDSLQHAGVYEDDSQIDMLTVARDNERSGQLHVTVQAMNYVVTKPLDAVSENKGKISIA